MGYRAQRQDDGACPQSGELDSQVRIAVADLLGPRLVAGRHTLHRVGDPTVAKHEAVIRSARLGTARKSELVQRAVEQDSGVIAREGTAGGVRAVQTGRESDDQEPRVGIAERRNRRAVVSRKLLTPRFQKRGETWATLACRIEDGHQVRAILRSAPSRRSIPRTVGYGSVSRPCTGTRTWGNCGSLVRIRIEPATSPALSLPGCSCTVIW